MRKFWLLAVVLLVFVAPTAAQEDLNPDLLAQLQEIEAFVTEERGLELLEPLDRRFPTRADVETFINTELDEQLTDEIVQREMAFYVAFGLLEPDVDIVAAYAALLEDQVAGYYDPEEKTLNTILLNGATPDGPLPAAEQIFYAHELQHALQDQHFDLQALLNLDEDLTDLEPDRVLAIQSLVEGDATALMDEFTLQLVSENRFLAFSLLGQIATSGGLTLPPDTPPILMRELLSPYTVGAEFVDVLRVQGGWPAVDAAFANPPQSMEQVIHPQRYLDGDTPLAVALEPTDAALGDGWEMLMERTLGEFYLRAHLDEQIGGALVAQAATGWGGDRYRIYRSADSGALALVLRLAWDTPTDLDEFNAAYLEYADNRFRVAQDAGNCWVTDAESLCLSSPDPESGDTIITYAPTQELALRLLASQSVELVAP